MITFEVTKRLEVEMGEIWLNGELYINSDGRVISLAEDFDATREVDIWSTNEEVKELYCLKNRAQGSICFETSASDLSWFDELCKPMRPPTTFTYEYDVPIMIQARWHKKKRINKKWLKRFGMKYDTVKRRVEARVISLDTNSGDIEFENTGDAECIWRQDQTKKYLKAEW